MRTRLTVFAIGLSLVLVQAIPGSAHLRGHRDSGDTAGSDLRWVALERVDHGRVLVARVQLWSRKSTDRIIFSFDTRGDGHADYYLRVKYDGASSGIVEAGLYRANWTRTDARISIIKSGEDDFPFWFPVSFKWWRLHATRHIRWRVSSTSWVDPGPLDFAPDRGWYGH